jgi:predicted PurR-regulated permease PerM
MYTWGMEKIVKSILFVVFLGFLYYIRDIVLVVLASIVLASAVDPIAQWLKKYHIGRLPSVIFIYLLIGASLACLFIFFVPLILSDAVTYLGSLPESIKLSDIWSPIRDFGSIANKSFSVKELTDGLRLAVSGGSEGIFKTASTVFGGALSFVLIVVLSFYFAVQENGVANFLRLVTPVKTHEYVVGLWKRAKRKIGYWMQGQILLALLVGILVYLGLTILGIRHALLLAVIAGLFEIIPVFGPILAAIPAVIIASVDGGATTGAFVIGLYIIIQQFENHLLYPLVVQKVTGVSPIIVILALVIGGRLAGFLGALLAVPIAAAIMEYVGDIERSRRIGHTNQTEIHAK